MTDVQHRPVKWPALLAGPTLLLIALLLPAPADMAPAAWLCAGMGLWMAIKAVIPLAG